ncbi:MAG: hypothetical protein ACOYXT_12585 [Bacteroidota bacterium]
MRSSKGNAHIREHYFTVPSDMLMDVLQVVVKNSIRYRITEVSPYEGCIKLYVNSEGQQVYYDKAVENIEVMLDEYMDFVRLCDER